MNHKNAFTLLELCIVIILFSVIAALLFLVYSSGNKTDWKRVKCLSNMKQQGLALVLYAQDYDGLLPQNPTTWMDASRPYIKNEEALHCPSLGPKEYGYAFDVRVAGKNQKKLKSPDQVILLLESTNRGRNASSSGEGLSLRHNKHGNVVFADGHARLLNREKIASEKIKL